jgi:quercetin dioxygenase-like cupin family protein
MKIVAALAAFLTAAILMPGLSTPSDTVYFARDKVDEALEKGSPLGNLFTAPDLRLMANRKSGSGGGEVHEKETDVVYVLDGTATMQTGGTVVNGKTIEPGQIRGVSVQGGQTWHLSKGDLLVIPAGTPHQIKESQSFDHLTVKVITAEAPAQIAVTYLNHREVAGALARNLIETGHQVPHLVDSPTEITCGHRSGPGEVEVHEKQADVMYVIDGAATLVTGGTLVGGKMTRPGEIKGTDIQGGQTQRVSKGDVMVIPAGTPHWHKEVPQSITYLTVKVRKL